LAEALSRFVPDSNGRIIYQFAINTGRSKTAIEQDLRDQAAKRVADDKRGGIQTADDLLVMSDDFCDAECCYR
jgi:hypothetical protein